MTLKISTKTLDPFTNDFQLGFFVEGGVGNISINGRASDKAMKAGDPKACFKAAATEALKAAMAEVDAL